MNIYIVVGDIRLGEVQFKQFKETFYTTIQNMFVHLFIQKTNGS